MKGTITMNDPHVESLTYKVMFRKDVDYSKASPLTEETENFVFTINQENALFKMKTHFSREEEAKKVTDKFLETCSIYWGLQNCPDEISFLYETVEIIDRQKNQDKHPIKYISGTITGYNEIEVDFRISKSKFLSAPRDFVINPDLETIYNRYKGYLENKEPLTSMAYFCLTVLEEGQGRKVRKDVAKIYQIDFNILNKWGDLSSEKG